MTDTGTAAAEPITLEAFDPAGLLMDANARSNAEATVGKAFVAELKAYAKVGDGAAAGYRDMLVAELARASGKRAQMIALAMVLGAAEHGVRDVHTWHSAEDGYWSAHSIPAAARYLAWLAEHTGYGLSEIEAEVAHATVGAGEPAGEPEPGPGEGEQTPDNTDAEARQDQAEPDAAGSPASTEAG